ncbi:MAG: alr [Solirubrobacterales bacterium]|nr:alr [Solirubrobacterales bacterium]
MGERALARIDLAAITRNCRRLERELTGGARLGVVVKADGYGHGAREAAVAAVAGGAQRLFVATAREAAELGPQPVPVAILGTLSPEELAIALEAGAEVTAWTHGFVAALEAGTPVHVKLDTGMGRLGTRDPAEATAVAEAAEKGGAVVAGLMTHFATADEPGDAFFGEQLERFRAWAQPLRERFPGALLHAANSAGTLRDPGCHFDLVRCGVAIYGLDPFQEHPAARELEPALSLTSYVGAVKPLAVGQSVGYGRRFVAEQSTTIATVPIGYGDGWRRALTNNAEVVIGGERHPLVGTVSMDNVTIDLGPETGVRVGDEVTLIGAGISAEEVARRLETLNYEVTCGLTSRVRRVHG